MPTAQLDKKKAPPSKDTSVAIDEVLPDDTNIAKVGINVADLDIKKIQISSPKKTSYDFDEEDLQYTMNIVFFTLYKTLTYIVNFELISQIRS